MILTAEQAERARALRAQMRMAGAVVARATEDPGTLLACETVFDWWRAGVAYAEGDVVRHGAGTEPEIPGHERDSARNPYHCGLYRVRQAVTSAEHQPPDAEGMLAIYTPVQVPDEGGEALPWVSGEIVGFGERRTYGGVVYECVMPGGAGANVWAPDEAPAIWRRISI